MGGEPRSLTILETRIESPTVKSFYFEYSEDVEPGQFLMVWVPGVGEAPFSVSRCDGNTVCISVRKAGEVTSALHRMKEGDKIGVRGPFGQGFKLKGNQIALLAGGCGAAPLLYLASVASRENKKVHAFVGASGKDEILFKEEFEKYGDLHVCTDDGSYGRKGFPTDAFEEILGKEDIDAVYTCGPEKMMKKVFDICSKKKIPMQASLERHMKCGVGLCGACLCDGLCVCKDGPVFEDQLLGKMKEFGKEKRDACGVRGEV
jgi:dihydroorotate dehydrogenase electron transfer subunit|tara:strand:- start:4429 stop:5211 length:783 start_codon:yes stop_codon:yes gene_type:complete